MDHRQLLALLVLLHLVHGAMNAGRQNSPQRPASRPQQNPMPSPGGLPQAQGAEGVAQGHKGALAQASGLPALQNQAGMFPHQRNPNPYLMMAGQG